MKVGRSPCLYCEERTVEPNCHMTCSEFLEWEEAHKTEKSDIKRAKQEYMNKNRITVESIRRTKRRRY